METLAPVGAWSGKDDPGAWLGPALPPGTRLKRFTILGLLGQGGFGITYRAVEEPSGDMVAIKELFPGALVARTGSRVASFPNREAEFEKWTRQFEAEARTLARFGHLTSIVRVREWFAANGTFYIIMDYVDGPHLRQYLAQRLDEPLTESEVRAVLLRLLDALIEVHGADFLHRDIKPDNIIIRPDRLPVLIDFGSAREITRTGSSSACIVSYGYTPWEQYSSAALQGPWTDLYALGAVGYRMVTGITPQDSVARLRKDDDTLSAARLGGRRFSRDLLAAIDFAMRVRIEDRPQSGVALRALLTSGTGLQTSRTIATRTPVTARVDIERLPVTGLDLFGREWEIAFLDRAWDEQRLSVVSLVAWGGVGKSTLVGHWLDRLAADGWRGAARVFGWSFFSQGNGDRVTTADAFIDHALAWFGATDFAGRSPWAKGEMLAALVRQERTLLVLDGLEPLQWGGAGDPGRIKDPALAILLTDLARDNPGLVVITTREPVADLMDFQGPMDRATAAEMDLELLSKEAGRALLRVRGVRGPDEDLAALSEAYSHHALAVALVAAYLRQVPGHAAAAGRALPDLPDVSDEEGRHARRVMAAFAERFGDGPEVELLRLLSLFDRPADAAALAALRAPPTIPGLTEHVAAAPVGATTDPPPFTHADWLHLIARLRKLGLVAEESHEAEDALDAHPLIREHFADRLKRDHPEAWREGHRRLYEHYQALPEKQQPDRLDELEPLYRAVVHGCQAGLHQDALDHVYFERINRGTAFYSTNQLGAFGPDLAALASFFETPWVAPVDTVTEGDRAWLLSLAAFRLRALGRLPDAVEPTRAGLDGRIAQDDWENAAISAANLCELLLVIGAIDEAVAAGRQAVGFAVRADDTVMGMMARIYLANALAQAGKPAEAADLFAAAEGIQKHLQPQYPFLYSLRGYLYCDLLLEQGRWAEVQERVKASIEGRTPSDSALHIALDRLAWGRAGRAAAPMIGRSVAEMESELDASMEGLRQAGAVEFVTHGLLMRAELRRLIGVWPRAQRDLDEAFALARRCGMKLQLADAHLEQTRLCLAQGATEGNGLAAARSHVEEAAHLIAETGYHRRDAPLRGLQAQVASWSS